MTAAECEIVADAACHLKAIEAKILDPWLLREVVFVLGMLATLPLEGEPEPERFSARV